MGYHSERRTPTERTPGEEAGPAEAPAEAPTAPDAQPSGEFQIVALGLGRKSFAGVEVPEGGCWGEARRYLAQGLPVVENEQFGLQLKNEAAADAERDARVQDGFRSWSSCMEKAGYDYSTPRDANNDPRWSGQTPSPLEISTAIADVDCKKETGLLNTWVAVSKAYEQRYVDKHAAALAELTTAMEAPEKRAIEIINRG